MAENTPTPPANPTPDQPAPAPRKRRRWPFVLLGLVVLLLLLVLLIPTIASTGVVRSIVLGKVNEQINGRVTIEDWSLGWFGGTVVRGVRVFDDQNQEIASVGRLTTDLTVMDVVKGKLALGNTVIDEPNLTKFVIDKDGNNNFARLSKSTSTEPVVIPEMSGDVRINNLRGAVIQQHADGRQDTLFVEPSTVHVKFASVNGPIDNDAKLAVKVNDGPVGTVSAAGTVTALGGGLPLPVDKIQADQKIGLSNLQAAAANPFLTKSGMEFAGVVNGDLAVKTQGTDATVDGAVRVVDFAAGGKALNGDTVKSAKIDIPIQITRAGNLVTIKSLKVDSDLVDVDAAGQLPLDALQNLTSNKAPGADGSLKYAVTIESVPNLLNQLRNTAKLQQGVTLTSGRIATSGELALAKDKASAKTRLEVVDVKGTNNNQPVALSNITLDAGSTILPAGDILAGLRDITVGLASSFATLNGGGPSVAKLDFKGGLKLADLQRELGQFVDLGGLQMNGTGTFALSSNGDVTNNAAPVTANLTLDLADLAIAAPDKTKPGNPVSPVLNQPHVGLAVAGTLNRSADGAPQMVKGATVKLSAGQANAPTVTLDAGADIDLVKKSVPAFTLTNLSVPDLAKVQREFAPNMKELSVAGALNASGSGSFTDNVLTFAQPLVAKLQNVTLVKHTANANSTVLAGENFDVNVLGKVGVGDVISANLTTLSVASSSNLVNVQLAQGKPLDVRLANGAASGTGTVLLKGDLKRLQDVGLAFSASSPDKRLSSGTFDGSIDFARGQANTDVKAALALANITIPGALNNESAKIDFGAAVPDDVSRVVGSATVSGSFGDVKATKFDLNPKAPLWGMVTTADVTISSNDVSKGYALMNAFSPPAPQPAAAPGAAPVEQLPPLEVVGGQLNVAVNVARKDNVTTANVSDLRVQNLSLRRGQRSYVLDPVAVKLAATLNTVNDANLTAAQQLKSLKVEQLAGSLGIAELSMPEPITVTDPAGNPSAQGSIALSGKIQKATELLAVLNGAAYPYQGDYSITQKVTTSPDGFVGLAGSVKATGFRVLDAKTGQPTFAEDQVAITNTVTLDTKPRTINGVTSRTLNTVNIQGLTVDMQSSGALKLGTKGIIGREVTKSASQWLVIQPLQVDLNYDLAKLEPIVKPVVAPTPDSALADLKMAGQHKVAFNVTGMYDTAAAGKAGLKGLNASGSLAAGSVETNGIKLEDFNRPFTMANGIVTFTEDPKNVAKVNGGTMDLNGFQIDLVNHPSPRLSLPAAALAAGQAQQQQQQQQQQASATQPAGKRLLAGVQVGPVMAAKALKFLGGLGEGADAGTLDVTVTECDKLPLGALMTQAVDPTTNERNDGRATFLVSLTGVKPGGPIFAALRKVAFIAPKWEEEIQGEIRNARVSIVNGVIDQDTSLAVGANRTEVFGFAGGIDVQNLAYRNFTVSVPLSYIKISDQNIRRFMPPSLALPLDGSISAPVLKPEGVFQAALGEAGKKALTGGLLQGVIGGDRNREQASPPPGTIGRQPQQQQQQAPATGGGSAQNANPAAPAPAPTLEDAATSILGNLLNKGERDREEKSGDRKDGKDGKNASKKPATTQKKR